MVIDKVKSLKSEIPSHFSQVLNLVLLTLLTYVLIRFCPANVVQNYLLASSMVYLSCLHLVRQIYDYGNFTYDVRAFILITN